MASTKPRAELEARVDDLMHRPYTMEVYWDEDYWAAEFPDLPGLAAAGDTWAELEDSIQRAKRAYFSAELELGHAIREPRSRAEHGGRVLLRLPKRLHREVARQAERDGVSVNTFLVAAVARELGRREELSCSTALPEAEGESDVVAVHDLMSALNAAIAAAKQRPVDLSRGSTTGVAEGEVA